MTVNEFKSYKLLADKILDLLIEENHSSIKDIKIIYTLLWGSLIAWIKKGIMYIMVIFIIH